MVKEGIRLRENGEYQDSIDYFKNLIESEPDNGELHYQCAWSHDASGREKEAIPFYKAAISLGLKDEDLKGAYVGLGSTYRTLGRYKEAESILREGMERFPDHHALKVFYGMTLHNLGEHSDAMEILLHILAETSEDHSIQSYKKAILLYASQMDTIWDQ
ncbi:tetratricopeptide repeat protein [Rossellomorea aquimaris]|nr:tetratricopeptide repeat protein [Rossellomorea aquimaris]